jgi:hypothetical protein
MPACPNCGRSTLRTKDWACQWCGYPLISRAFKVIDKTFKELQEERRLGADAEPAVNDEPEPMPEPEPPPPPPAPARPIYRTVPRPEPKFETPPDQRVEIKQIPHIQPARPQPKPEPVQKILPPPVLKPEQKPVVIPPAAPIILPPHEVVPVLPPAPRIEPPPAPRVEPSPSPRIEPPPQATVEPTPVPAPRPKPEIIVEPPPPVVPTVKLEAVRDGMQITSDQIDELFRADKSAAHSRLAGMTITVRGKVEKVFIKDHLDVRYIMVTGLFNKTSSSLRCTFNKEDSSKASRLNEGDEVLVKGKYDGFSKNIMFKDCAIV